MRLNSRFSLKKIRHERRGNSSDKNFPVVGKKFFRGVNRADGLIKKEREQRIDADYVEGREVFRLESGMKFFQRVFVEKIFLAQIGHGVEEKIFPRANVIEQKFFMSAELPRSVIHLRLEKTFAVNFPVKKFLKQKLRPENFQVALVKAHVVPAHTPKICRQLHQV